MRSVLTALCLFASTAYAVPAQFTHQGRLLDADGVPLDGDTTITFRVTDSESGGAALWEEILTVTVSNGFYSAVLGTDEEGNPLDVEVLSQAPTWLELQLEGEGTMFPRTPIHSVPYATMATVAEEVSGGPVDASEVAVDGSLVINDAGEWVGPAPTVSWADLEGVPADFADGVDDDTDTDSFADLGVSCLDGDVPVWDGVAMEWVCGDDLDTVLSEEAVDAMVADNGYAMVEDVFSGSFADLADVPAGLEDGDDDTTLGESEVDAMVADNGYAMATDVFSGIFSDLSVVPDGLADGDDNTQLSEDEVDEMVSDNGHALETDVDALLAEIDTLKDQVAALEEAAGSDSGTVMYGDYTIYNSGDLAGLAGFTEITGDLSIQAGDLPDIDILTSLNRIGGSLYIKDNTALTSLDGLTNVTSIGSHVTIDNNDSLADIGALNEITGIEGQLRIQRNLLLGQISGLNSLLSVHGMYINDNPAMENVDGLESLTTVSGYLQMIDNTSLTNIDGLSSITEVQHNGYMYDNSSLCNSLVIAFFERLGDGLGGTAFTYGNDDSC